jgi:hypothetical protein
MLSRRSSLPPFPSSLASLLLAVTAAVVAGGLMAGCGSSGPTVVYPSNQQEDGVQRTTRSGYDFLRSKKGSSAVTISLRGATSNSLRIYTSVHNTGSGGTVQVDPSTVRVEATMKNGKTREFEAYAPGEVPGVLSANARSNVGDLAQMSAAVGGFTQSGGGSFLYGSVKSSKQTGSYSSESDEPEVSLQDLLLQPVGLSSNQAVDGMVYTPFTSNAETVRIEVPVGETTHAFRYRLERPRQQS